MMSAMTKIEDVRTAEEKRRWSHALWASSIFLVLTMIGDIGRAIVSLNTPVP